MCFNLLRAPFNREPHRVSPGSPVWTVIENYKNFKKSTLQETGVKKN